MHEILRNLSPGSRVLDLGSGSGSVPAGHYPQIPIVCLDCYRPSAPAPLFVQADAARLPFPDRSFDALIANHSLEHVGNFLGTLKEIARVLRTDAALYIAVPDASTFSDHLYRWLYRGGGHVNPFRSSMDFARQVEAATGLPLAAERTLYSSFRFLVDRKIPAGAVALFSYAARILDRAFKSRVSIYGWAFYFGRITEEIDTTAWSNVCAKCGTGRSAAALEAGEKLRRRRILPASYVCFCGAWNLFTPDA